MRTIFSLSPVLVFVLTQFFYGCAPSTVGQLQDNSEAKPLNTKEILTLAKGNTLFLHGYKIDSYFYFDESGDVFAKDIFNNTDTGAWDISTNDELCFKMKDWWHSDLRCFPVFQDKDKYYLFNSSGVLEFSADFSTGDTQDLFRNLAKKDKTFLMSQSKKEKSSDPPAAEKTAEKPQADVSVTTSEEDLKSTVKWMAKNCPDCNLKEADLQGADLIGAQLQGANLTRANLSNANLRRANLEDADLEDADLSYANLPGANLRECDLTDANLTGANLIRADLTGADIDGAIFTGALLEGVEGLYGR